MSFKKKKNLHKDISGKGSTNRIFFLIEIKSVPHLGQLSAIPYLYLSIQSLPSTVFKIIAHHCSRTKQSLKTKNLAHMY